MCLRSCMAWSDIGGRLNGEEGTVPIEGAVVKAVHHFELEIVIDRQQDEVHLQEGHTARVSALYILHDRLQGDAIYYAEDVGSDGQLSNRPPAMPRNDIPPLGQQDDRH